MPILPLPVHQRLGLGALVVGLVAGSQLTASPIPRFSAGHDAHSQGAKRAAVIGLAVA